MKFRVNFSAGAECFHGSRHHSIHPWIALQKQTLTNGAVHSLQSGVLEPKWAVMSPSKCQAQGAQHARPARPGISRSRCCEE